MKQNLVMSSSTKLLNSSKQNVSSYEALAPRGNRSHLIVLCAAISISTNFQDAYANSYPNTAHMTFKEYFNDTFMHRGYVGGISEDAYTWAWSVFLSIWFVGYLLGNFATPFFTESIGRQRSLVLFNTVALIGTIISTIAVMSPSPEALFLGRTVVSISSGVSFGVLILFLQEITPTEVRGTSSFLSETGFLAMTVVGMGMGTDALLGKNLPLLLGIGCIPPAVAVILSLLMMETPKFLLLNKNDRKAAEKSLYYYQGRCSDEIIDSIMMESQGDKNKSGTVLADVITVFQTPHLRKAFILGVLILQVVIGIWPIIYLSTDLLQTYFSSGFAQANSFLFVLGNFVASIPGLIAVERFGRKPMILFFGSMNTFFLVLYCIFDRLALGLDESFKHGCAVSLVGYGMTYGAALGPIAYFITTELVIQHYRSLIQSMVFVVNTTACMIVSLITLPMYRWIEVWSFIPLFIIPSILCLTYIFFNLPETKGREIHEIVAELMINGQKVVFSGEEDGRDIKLSSLAVNYEND